MGLGGDIFFPPKFFFEKAKYPQFCQSFSGNVPVSVPYYRPPPLPMYHSEILIAWHFHLFRTFSLQFGNNDTLKWCYDKFAYIKVFFVMTKWDQGNFWRFTICVVVFTFIITFKKILWSLEQKAKIHVKKKCFDNKVSYLWKRC